MAELPVTIDDVRRAAAVIDGHVRRTPVLSCASLGEGIWLKAELLQRKAAIHGKAKQRQQEKECRAEAEKLGASTPVSDHP